MDPGQQIPPVIEVAGLRVGLMTCYDLRFPELALSLALNGAQLLVLPAAWMKGPQKEHHWATLLAARASILPAISWRQANAERAISG